MGKLIGGIAVGFVALFSPLMLMLGAVGAATNSDGASGSSSALASEMEDLGYQNGLMPDELLEVVSTHGTYECRVTVYAEAAAAWIALITTAMFDGVDIEGGWCYRTYAEQLGLWTDRECYIPTNCDGDPYPPTAFPGTSNHGWGLAVDVWGATDDILSCSSPEFLWLQINAPRFGWVHPAWAHCGEQSEEPWHWEYQGSVLLPATTTTVPVLSEPEKEKSS